MPKKDKIAQAPESREGAVCSAVSPDQPFSNADLCRELLEFCADAIWIKDRESRYLSVSAGFLPFVGFKRMEDIIGKTEADILGEDQARAAGEEEAQILATGEQIDKEEKKVWPDGRVSWVNTTKKPLRNPGGQIVGTIGRSREIPCRKLAEEGRGGETRAIPGNDNIGEGLDTEAALALEQRLLGKLMQTGEDLIYFKDRQGRFIRINNKLATLFGLSDPAQAIGKSDHDFYPGDLAQEYWEQEQQVFERGQSLIDREQRQVFEAGNVVWTSATKIPLKDDSGNVVGLFGISRDITDRKTAEQALQRTLAELERSNKELELFAYVASHDLQEPLRLVAAYSELLIRRYRDKLDEQADPLVKFITEGITRMQQLIQDLLAYSRVSSQKKPFTLCSAENILDRVLANLALAIREKKVEIVRDPLPELFGDETRLFQLFQNLIGNAIKFQGELPPRVHIGCKLADNGQEWIFSVKDNGIGIDEEYYQRIFVIFQRLHSRSKYSGTGIGLSICKRVVELHDGKIWVESAKGKGSTFFFSLPATTSPTKTLESGGPIVP